ncbi:hypothetical protein [Nostoc sp. ChiQUE01b]|uniref:hypothetical protein n=1 Tax=Nostoc sp. ChiQUE01b TaxID=3075376 RepID=UPI002AD5A7CA|nr:hypothetical protein [Nostoc sp. ChiQUE01b]MDZ8263103.1 hypothetical protein [Nostoc sp. ChiQUE01b]
MFDQQEIQFAKRMYQEGNLPSEILRFFALQNQKATVPDLMRLFQEALLLTYEDVQCIGGWWHDGTGELTDDQLDAFLLSAIAKSHRLG